MDISALTNVSSGYIAGQYDASKIKPFTEESEDFSSVLGAAMNMINETNDYQNAAESAQIQFALGESTSTHDLAAAQQKANLALSYTVAVRDKVLDAYKEIMNMSI
ncbi:MAG: flagellar hook-basal body complex protein FliE [Lachnospiraceae bacterium]|mgnify:CR=1 FL=1|jgi:flagellar hook-basal body complex protein FliE|nr:flagellar hook-basal body complex protein FliE [Lachnospiraceae bacterium]